MVGVSQRPTQCTEHILGGDGQSLQSRAACGVAGAVGGCQSCLQRRAGNSDTRTDTAQCWIRIASMLDITIFHSGSALWQPGSVRERGWDAKTTRWPEIGKREYCDWCSSPEVRKALPNTSDNTRQWTTRAGKFDRRVRSVKGPASN
jgi:hypothetical protein